MEYFRKVIYLTYYNMRSRYRKTFAGFLWVISSPILTFLVQSLIFKEIFKFNIDKYPLYLLAGLLPWFFISQTLFSTTSCLVVSREILLAFKIEPFVVIAAQVLDQFFNFIVAFLIVGIFLILPDLRSYGFMQLMSIPIDLVLIFYLVLVLNSLLSFWHVFYRDINFVTQFVLSLAFYLTPVFYTEDIFPHKYAFLLKINFLIPFIKLFQTSLFSWNVENWIAFAIKAILINIIITIAVKLSLKFKMRDFYINV